MFASRFFGCAFLTLMLAGPAWATPQVLDVLEYQGKKYPIWASLMEPYFRAHPEKRPKSSGWSSANQLGYVSTFEIVDGGLVLKDIIVDIFADSRSVLKDLLPDGKGLKIDWYNGLLLSTYGRNDANPYSLESLIAYEHYSIFEVVSGQLTAVRHFNNKQYRAFVTRQFRAFKNTPEYRQEVKRVLANNPGMDVSDVHENIKIWLIPTHTQKFLVK